MNTHLIPALGSMEAKTKFVNIEAWSLFARKITKNPYMQQFIFTRDNSICAWCGKKVVKDGFHIHHSDYEHICNFGKEIRIDRPTEKRPNKMVSIPDCETCHKIHLEYFEDCTKRLHIVHKICNSIINDHAYPKN